MPITVSGPAEMYKGGLVRVIDSTIQKMYSPNSTSSQPAISRIQKRMSVFSYCRRPACIVCQGAGEPPALRPLPQFHNDPAQFEQAGHAGEIQRPPQPQAAILADAHQLMAIISSAMPHAAAKSAGDGVFGDHEQHLAA